MKLARSSSVTALSFLLVGGWADIQGQTQPSLDQTLSWLQARLHDAVYKHVVTDGPPCAAGQPCYVRTVSQTVSNVSYSGCTLNYTLVYPTGESHYEVPLDQLAGAAVRAHPLTRNVNRSFVDPPITFDIWLRSSSSVISVTDSDKRKKIDRARISSDDQELAERLANGLSHAIQLCGGKPEPVF
jgi:hypothetical protein